MAENKIDYGKLAGKVAHDAGGFARKGIGLIAGAIKPENIRKGVSAVKSVADAAVQGWEDAGTAEKTEPAANADTVPTGGKEAETANENTGTNDGPVATTGTNDSDDVHIESVTETPSEHTAE